MVTFKYELLTSNHLLSSRTLHYIDRDGKEHFHTVKSHPQSLEKKKTLLAYFTDYMNEHLLKVNIYSL